MEWIKKRKKPLTQDDEEAKLNDALLEFQAEFGQESSVSTQSKTFLRGSIVEGNKTITAKPESKVYAPKMSFSLNSKTSNVGSKDFDEAKKLAAAKARRMLEDAARSKNLGVVPKVVVPQVKPMQRPPKPGSSKAKAEKPKVSNLEMFKLELQRVQEDREKRRDLRTHLEKVGMDSAVVDRIAPSSDRPFHSGGEFDDDPYTTNLYVCNIPHSVTEEDLLFTFGSFGPLAALKILYPRSEEERRRPHICAFVAFMSRTDVDRFMNEVRTIIIRENPIRFSFARPVAIPTAPYYIPPQLLNLQCPDPISGLPFNAQPLKAQAEEFLKKYKSFPPLAMLPEPTHPAYEDYMEVIKNSTVRVVIPPDRATLRLINRTVAYVITEGAHFEAMICSQEYQNPMFQFLWDNSSACHVYYRWKMFSLLQGDSIKSWRREKFRMFKNGSWWIPPYSINELNRTMPECLYKTTCTKTYPERWLKPRKPVQTTVREEERKPTSEMSRREREEEAERQKKERQARKMYMSDKKRDKLEKLIRDITPEQNVVGDAMVWCVENSVNGKEISECICESLTIDETPLHKKIARLYLINDILANCVQRTVRDVFLYRAHFEMLLDKIFIPLGRTYRNIASRIKQEQFKQRVMNIFRHWEETALYPIDKLIRSQNLFLGLIETDENEPRKYENGSDVDENENDDDEDLDGVPIDFDHNDKRNEFNEGQAVNGDDDDDDVDGVPIDSDMLTSTSTSVSSSGRFKPAAMTELPPPLFASKWDEKTSGAKSQWDDDDEIGNNRKRGDINRIDIEVKTEKKRASLSPGEIEETPKRSISSTISIEDERRRKLMRDIEVRAMTMLDDLESDHDPNAKRKVDDFRRIEMAKVEKILEKESVEKREKEKKRENRQRSRSREKKRKRENRSRSRSRERTRDRERGRFHRDRSSERDRRSERERR